MLFQKEWHAIGVTRPMTIDKGERKKREETAQLEQFIKMLDGNYWNSLRSTSVPRRATRLAQLILAPISRRVLLFFSFLIIPVFFSCFFLLRHGPSIAVVWPFHPFPLAVDVNKSRHESWKRWQFLAVLQPSKWRWKGRNRAEQTILQSRRLCTVDRFWVLWPRFWHRLRCPPFHYRRVSGLPARQIVAKATNSSSDRHFLIFCRPLQWWWRLLHLMTVRSRLPSGWFLPKGSTRLEPQRHVIQLNNYI